jgi:hypothetical protein
MLSKARCYGDTHGEDKHANLANVLEEGVYLFIVVVVQVRNYR